MRFITNTIQYLKYILPAKKYLFAGLLFFAGYTFAADVSTQDSDVIEAIVQVLNLVFTIITFLLTPAIILCGWLLSPDWTMGDFFGLRPYFIQVWVLVSNLVYIIFALMLLWMAVMQIFSSESNYAFKKKLPRFLVGIMIVPFTWLIVSWTLSFANQAVAAVLSIPSGAIAQMQTDENGGLFHLRTIPTKFTLDFSEDAPGASAETASCADNGSTGGGVKCISPAEFIANNQSGPFFIILIYAYDIFKIQKTEMIDFNKVCKGIGDEQSGQANSSKCISDLGKLLRKFGVAFITTTFFAIILIALCWVLLARAFKLWVYVMFSPLFGLAYAVSDEGLGKTFESEGGGGEGVSLGEVGFKPFFSLAMVPVLVSAVLSFGLLFIGVVNNTFTSGALSDNGSGTFCTSGEFMVKYCIQQDGSAEGGYSSRIIIGDDSNTDSTRGGNYAITFEFGSMLSEFTANSAGNTLVGGAQGFADGAKDIFAHIILSLIALAVMWMGVKAAVAHDEVTKAAFAPFAKFGDSVGNFVQHIPSYLPTPHPAFAAFNPATFDAVATGINKNVDSTVTESRTRLADMINGSDGKLSAAISGFSSGANNFNEAVSRFADTSAKSPEQAQKLLKEGLTKVDATIAANSPDRGAFEAFKKAVDNADPKEIKTVLETHSDVVAKLDSGALGGGQMKGVGRLGSLVGANSNGSQSNTDTGAFSGHTIGADGSAVTSAGRVLNSTDMSGPQKDKIKSLFSRQSSIDALSDADTKTKLKDAGFNSAEVDRLSAPDAKKAAKKLAADAGVPN